jgi:hypothetical protein
MKTGFVQKTFAMATLKFNAKFPLSRSKNEVLASTNRSIKTSEIENRQKKTSRGPSLSISKRDEEVSFPSEREERENGKVKLVEETESSGVKQLKFASEGMLFSCLVDPAHGYGNVHTYIHIFFFFSDYSFVLLTTFFIRFEIHPHIHFWLSILVQISRVDVLPNATIVRNSKSALSLSLSFFFFSSQVFASFSDQLPSTESIVKPRIVLVVNTWLNVMFGELQRDTQVLVTLSNWVGILEMGSKQEKNWAKLWRDTTLNRAAASNPLFFVIIEHSEFLTLAFVLWNEQERAVVALPVSIKRILKEVPWKESKGLKKSLSTVSLEDIPPVYLALGLYQQDWENFSRLEMEELLKKDWEKLIRPPAHQRLPSFIAIRDHYNKVNRLFFFFVPMLIVFCILVFFFEDNAMGCDGSAFPSERKSVLVDVDQIYSHSGYSLETQ